MTLVRYCIAAFFCFDLDGDPNTAKVHSWIDLCDGRAIMWWAYIRVPSKEHAGSDSGSGDYLLHRRTCGLDGGSSRGIGGLRHWVRAPSRARFVCVTRFCPCTSMLTASLYVLSSHSCKSPRKRSTPVRFASISSASSTPGDGLCDSVLVPERVVRPGLAVRFRYEPHGYFFEMISITKRGATSEPLVLGLPSGCAPSPSRGIRPKLG